MSVQQNVKQQLLKIAGSWPKDLIRPNHQFSQAVTQIANAHPAWAESSTSSSSKASSSEVRDGHAMAGALTRLLHNSAIKQVRSLSIFGSTASQTHSTRCSSL